METKYAHHKDGISMTQDEVFTHTLLGTLPAEILAPSTTAIDKVSKAKIRFGVAELTAMNIDNVQRWLTQIGDGVVDPKDPQKYLVHPSPRSAIELFIELLQFSVPKMKAVAIDVRDGEGNLQKLTVSDLQSIVSTQ